MKRAILAVAPLLALSSPALAAEQKFTVTGFESISVSVPHKVIVATGKAPGVRAVGDQKSIDRLEVDVASGTLRIREKKSDTWFSWKDGEVLTIYVTTHTLNNARLAGSGDVAVDRMKGQDVKLSLAGSGDLNVGVVTADRIDVSLAGSGDMAMTGTCGAATISIAGSGNIDAPGLKCQSLTGKIAGSGDITTEVVKHAKLSIAGSGDIKILGKPQCEVKTLGSGKVSCGD
jgi:uncharacterized protein YaiE (UPF0345 family)